MQPLTQAQANRLSNSIANRAELPLAWMSLGTLVAKLKTARVMCQCPNVRVQREGARDANAILAMLIESGL